VLSFDFNSKKEALVEARDLHFEVVSFLRECSSESHIIPSRTLANRIEVAILSPIQFGLEIIEKVDEIGVESIPDTLIERWMNLIEGAIFIGGCTHGI
jgi:hypothetical protein